MKHSIFLLLAVLILSSHAQAFILQNNSGKEVYVVGVFKEALQTQPIESAIKKNGLNPIPLPNGAHIEVNDEDLLGRGIIHGRRRQTVSLMDITIHESSPTQRMRRAPREMILTAPISHTHSLAEYSPADLRSYMILEIRPNFSIVKVQESVSSEETKKEATHKIESLPMAPGGPTSPINNTKILEERIAILERDLEHCKKENATLQKENDALLQPGM